MSTAVHYADANATYPVDPAHYDAVAALLKQVDGNPSSIHAAGRRAKVALEEARAAVARMLGARATEVIFTSGATEANNLALQGVVGRVAGGKKPHVVVLATEHSSVLEPAKLLQERGLCELSIASVDRLGRVEPEAVAALVRPETVFVGVMHANNEVGTLHPVERIAEAVRARNADAHVHVDAVQTLGKLDLTSLAGTQVGSIALSAHKIGGFKGVGALWLRSGTKLAALIAGGGQERGRRAGTENLPGILSFGLCCEALRGHEAERAAVLLRLRNAWIDALARVVGVKVHGAAAEDREGRASLPNTVNFHVDGVLGDDILLNFDLAGIHASSGSACASGTARPSSVLLAMGYDEHVALNSVRVSLWHGSKDDDLQLMARTLEETVARVRGA
jgi:cysteine desulfurase